MMQDVTAAIMVRVRVRVVVLVQVKEGWRAGGQLLKAVKFFLAVNFFSVMVHLLAVDLIGCRCAFSDSPSNNQLPNIYDYISTCNFPPS